MSSSTIAPARRLPGFISLLRQEYLKTSRRLMTRVAVGMIVLLTGLAHIGAYLLIVVFGVGRDVDRELFLLPHMFEELFLVLSLLGPILTVVLASGIVGSEYSWGTIRTVVGSGTDRTRLLLAKLTTLAGASILLTLAGVVTLLLSSTVISLMEGEGLGFSWVSMSTPWDLLLMILRCSFVLAVIGTVGFATAQITRSLAAGIAVGLGFLFLTPLMMVALGALGRTGERINEFHILVNADVLDSMNTFGAQRELTLSHGPWAAAGILLAYAVVCSAVAIVSFRRRDIVVG